jgi:hypothetical protein
MPVLGLGKQGLYPHLAFPQCLAVWLSVTVAPHPFEILFLKAAPDPTFLLLALRAASLERTRVAGRGFSSVPDGSLLVVEPLAAQGLPLGTDLEILFGVVNELILGKRGPRSSCLGNAK